MSRLTDHPLRTARRRVGAFVRDKQWVLPLIGSVLGVVLGLAMFNVDNAPMIDWTITVGQSRATLAALVVLMFTILSLSMSMTTITLDNMGSHYSLRMLPLEVDDYRTKIATSVFALAVSFIAVELFKLTELSGDDLTPRASFMAAVLLIICSGIALFWQLNYTVQSLRLDRTLSRLHRVIRRAALADDRRARHWVAGSRPERVGRSAPLLADSSGYVLEVDLNAIRKTIEGNDLRVVIDRHVGASVTKGDEIGFVIVDDGSAADHMVADITSSVALESGRGIAHDVGFGVRILVDIASLALSPAINDPYTAVQVADTLAAVFEVLADRQLGPRALVVDGDVVAWVARPTLAEHLTLATDQVTRYGATEPTVIEALLRICDVLERCAVSDTDRRAAHDCRRDIVTASTRSSEVDTDNR